MARCLSVVESAYRATVEEQDDTAVWFTMAIRAAGADVALLLRGNAVNYAVRGQDAGGLRFGSREVRVPPRLDADIATLMEKGVPVYLVSEDAKDRGIPAGTLIHGVQPVSRSRLFELVGGYGRIIHW